MCEKLELAALIRILKIIKFSEAVPRGSDDSVSMQNTIGPSRL